MARIAEEKQRGADAGDLTGFLSAIKIVRDKQLEPQARAAPTMQIFKNEHIRILLRFGYFVYKERENEFSKKALRAENIFYPDFWLSDE